MKTFCKALAASFLLFICFSCSQLGLYSKTGIVITLPQNVSRSGVTKNDPLNFKLTVKDSSENVVAEPAPVSDGEIPVELDPGTYTVELKAYTQTDTEFTKPYFEASKSGVVVTSNQTTEVTLTLRQILFTVTFIDETNTELASVDVERDGVAEIPETIETEKDGYTFDGWYLGDEKYDFTSPITSNITLTAKWSEVIPPTVYYTVTFADSDGTVIDSSSVEENTAVTEITISEKEGYDFDGWYLGDEKYDFTSPVTSDITLTAKWTIKVFTVTFNADNGTESNNQEINWNEKVAAPETPEKDGYVFDGWYLGDEKYDFTSPVTSDITLTAKWTEIAPSTNISVTFPENKYNYGDISIEYSVKVNESGIPEITFTANSENKDITYYIWFWGTSENDYSISQTYTYEYNSTGNKSIICCGTDKNLHTIACKHISISK